MSAVPTPADVADVELRLRTLRTGVWPSIAVCGYLALYTVGTRDERAHSSVILLLTAVALIASIAIARVPIDRVVRSRWREPFFVGWSIGLVVLIAVAAMFDGGAVSPIATLLFLPLVYSALSYPLRSLLVVGAVDVAAYVVLAVAGDPIGGWHAFLVAGALVNATWMSGWLSRNHEAQRAELVRVSRTDPLTGTLNRRGFQERFAAELARARREDSALTLVVLDLDRFKRINDTFGHAAGDRVLRDVVAALGATLRGNDTIGRLGGDEFGVLFAGDRPEPAIRRLLEVVGEVASLTVGSATYPRDGVDQSELHHAADADLYAGKQQRRQAV